MVIVCPLSVIEITRLFSLIDYTFFLKLDEFNIKEVLVSPYIVNWSNSFCKES